MARNERKRQKKLAKKNTKRKKALLNIKKTEGKDISSFSDSKQVLIAAKSPIHECLVMEKLFETGMGNVIVSRKMANGSMGVSSFLLDIYCLGVKDAFFSVLSQWEYQTNLQRFMQRGNYTTMDPACTRKLVEDAEAYARDLGFSPNRDYQMASRIFGDIDKSACARSFEFGKDGKPFYMSGPNDTPERSRKIINTLFNRCGPDGFHYMMGIGGPFDEDLDEDLEEGLEEDLEEDLEEIIDEDYEDSDLDYDILTGRLKPGAEMPTRDFFDLELKTYEDLAPLLHNLIVAFEEGYFLAWEAIIREEEGLPLSRIHREFLSQIDLDKKTDERILLMDGVARPAEPWYQTVRKVASRLLIEPLKTSEPNYQLAFDGWPKLVKCLKEETKDLTLPEGARTPIDIVPVELQHKLWLQYCFDALCGLGQTDELTLENEDQQDRIEMLIGRLREHVESVRFFDLTIEKILEMVIMPKKEEEIFIRLMLEALKMQTIKEGIVKYL